jgi:hypothetical protein
MKTINMIKIRVLKPYIDRINWIKYLTIDARLIKTNEPEILKEVSNEKLAGFLEEQIENYLDGKQIDKEIHSVVLNCADMYGCGEPIVLRAGDYISLQTYLQKAAHLEKAGVR